MPGLSIPQVRHANGHLAIRNIAGCLFVAGRPCRHLLRPVLCWVGSGPACSSTGVPDAQICASGFGYPSSLRPPQQPRRPLHPRGISVLRQAGAAGAVARRRQSRQSSPEVGIPPVAAVAHLSATRDERANDPSPTWGRPAVVGSAFFIGRSRMGRAKPTVRGRLRRPSTAASPPGSTTWRRPGEPFDKGGAIAFPFPIRAAASRKSPRALQA
jgi:hypothetical protein